jgi:hypothetical protein
MAEEELPFTLTRPTVPAPEPVVEPNEDITITPQPTAPEPERPTAVPFTLSRTSSPILPVSRSIQTQDQRLNIPEIVEEYGRPLLKEDFLEDERLQEIVYQSLEARRGGTTMAGRGATAVSGGATFGPENIRELPFEEVFETWQNYQRSFSAGQSVTVANELAHSLNQDEETMARLGAGYLLFDSMDNAFTGDGSWAEMGDALFDYTRSVVWDPTTLLTFGIGKAFSAVTGRVGAAASRNLMLRAYRRALSRGATGRAALSAVGGAARAAPYIAPDLAFNVGLDIAQQSQLIRTGAQEEYSAVQTGLAAAGTMAIPAIMLGIKGAGSLRRGALRNTIFGATDTAYLTREVSQETAWEMVMQRVDRDGLIDAVDDNFGRIQGDPENFLNWENAKIVAGEIVDENGERLTDDKLMNMFERYFWFGNPNEESRGYFNALKDAGFVVHPSMLEDNTISGVFGQAITFLSDESAERIVRQFEEVTGRRLGITPTADGLSAHFISRSNAMGEGLGIRSQLSRLERAGLTGRELLETAAGVGATEATPQRLQFAVSVYKRLLTSHLATTGANLKGFSQLVTIDTFADLFSATTYVTQSAAYRMFGNAEEAARYARLARATAANPLRRTAGLFTPDLDIEYANLVLEQNPEAMERLFREIAGDSGPNQALEQFNLDPDNLLNRSVDGVTRGAQTLTLVRLQDDLTKRWAFASNLDREISRTYGVSAQEFWARQDSPLEMRSEQFQDALNRAVYRTQRQTASVNWSTLPGRDGLRGVAKSIEGVVNRDIPGLGFIFPFTSFMNTTVATLGDLSGVNAMARMVGAARGRRLDFADQDFGELMGKAAVGWTAIGMGVPAALNRIQSGMSWNQEENEAGEIEDRTYDWPGSTIRLASQMLAHSLVGEDLPTDFFQIVEGLNNGEIEIDWRQVPDDLKAEFVLQAGPGQAVRDFDDALVTVRDSISAIIDGEEDLSDAFAEAAMSVLSRPVQGFTRPLDPINMAVGIARDGNMNPDLRQGPEQWNQAMRYINQLLPSVSGVDDLPRRATALRGTDTQIDLGRQMLGNRMSRYPNIAESMFNSAGIPSWRAIRWQGPPEVKNFMDGLAAPIFEREAIRALQENPDYFDMTTDQKNTILSNMRGRVRESVMRLMETRGTPRTLNAARRLSNANQDRVRRVMQFLGYEGDISDVLSQEDAFDAINRIQYFVDNYEQIFHGDLSLE